MNYPVLLVHLGVFISGFWILIVADECKFCTASANSARQGRGRPLRKLHKTSILKLEARTQKARQRHGKKHTENTNSYLAVCRERRTPGKPQVGDAKISESLQLLP
jgi:hypothetical protein